MITFASVLVVLAVLTRIVSRLLVKFLSISIFFLLTTDKVVWVDDTIKKRALHDLLLSLPPCRTLVFVNNVRQVDTIDDYLYNLEFPVTAIHSRRTQQEREDSM